MKQLRVWLTAVLGGLLLSGCSILGNSGSVGIIGGSDGPTAVFITGRLPNAAAIIIPAVLLTVLVAAGVIAYVLHRRKK